MKRQKPRYFVEERYPGAGEWTVGDRLGAPIWTNVRDKRKAEIEADRLNRAALATDKGDE